MKAQGGDIDGLIAMFHPLVTSKAEITYEKIPEPSDAITSKELDSLRTRVLETVAVLTKPEKVNVDNCLELIKAIYKLKRHLEKLSEI